MHRGLLLISTHGNFAERDHLFTGSERVANPDQQATRGWVWTMDAEYGLTNRFSLSASLPYIKAEFQEMSSEVSDGGVGDLTLFLRRVVRLPLLPSGNLGLLSLGASVPVGEGIANPVTADRNFVSGTFDPLAAIAVNLPVKGPLLALANGYARWIWGKDADGKQSGSTVMGGLGLTAPLYAERVTVNAGGEYLWRGADTRNGIPVTASGGQWAYVSAGISLAPMADGPHGPRGWARLSWTVWRDVNGTQLVEDVTIRFGITYGLDILSHPKPFSDL